MYTRTRTLHPLSGIRLAVLMLAALVLSACAQATPVAQPAATSAPLEPYTIGALLSVTGGAAPAGDNERKGVLLAIEQVNAAGGINGHPVKLVLEDDGTDPTKTVAAMLKLTTEDNVAAIIGPSTSTTTMASMDANRASDVPVLAMAGAAAVTQAGNPNIFRVAPTDAVAVTVSLDFIANTLKATKLAILYVEDTYSKGGADAFSRLAPNYGMEIVATESHGDLTNLDLTPELTNIKATDPEVLIVWFCGPGQAAAAKNVTQLAFDVIQVHPTCTQMPFVQAAGESAEGILFAGPKFVVANQLPEDDPQYKAIQKFSELYQKAYGEPPVLFSGFGWDAAQTVFEALARAGTDDPAAVRAALEETRYVGVTGSYFWTPADHDGLGPESLAVIKIENGGFVLAKD
ncbi:MAG: ABC transporter substrate-binding protein [Anaerolineae bacterium]